MGKRNRDCAANRLWQSSQLNNSAFLMYKDMIMQLAMNRFSWELPDECDWRYLEWILLTEGKATIASPMVTGVDGKLLPPKVFYSLKVAETLTPDKYAQPIRWTALGATGQTRYPVSAANGVLVYNDLIRTTPMRMINYYALLLANIDKAYRVNLNQQQTPWIIKGDPSLEGTLKNVYKQISGGEPAIITTRKFGELIDIEAISTQVPFIGQELQLSKTNVWGEVFTYLGIDSVTRKSERMVESEIKAEQEPSTIMGLSALNARRYACDELNRRFGLGVSVHWAHDNETENWDLVHNLEMQAELMGGGV